MFYNQISKDKPFGVPLNCKSLDTVTPYHMSAKISKKIIQLPFDATRYFWMSGKHCRPWSDANGRGILPYMAVVHFFS